MNNVANNKIGLWSLIVFSVFLLFQVYFSFSEANSFLSTEGLFQILWLSVFLVFLCFGLKCSIPLLFLLVFVYQFFGVLLVYALNSNLGEGPLGPLNTDSGAYHKIALLGRYQGINEFIDSLPSNYNVADLGFPLIMRYVYMLPGNSILNMKFLNILCHVGTTYLVFLSAKISNYNVEKVRLATLFIGLYPASIYFNASGLKEPIFLFVVSACISAILLAQRENKFIPLALFLIAITVFFRTVYPAALFSAFFFQMYLFASGRYKLIIRIFVLVLSLIVMGGVLFYLKSEFYKIASISFSDLQEERSGREVGVFENAFFIIVSVVGPLPTIKYNGSFDSYFLLVIPNIVKTFLSLSIVLAFFSLAKLKAKWSVSLWVFLVANIVMLVVSATALDHRYVYPFMSVFILLSANNLGEAIDLRRPVFWLYMFFASALIFLYNLR